MPDGELGGRSGSVIGAAAASGTASISIRAAGEGDVHWLAGQIHLEVLEQLGFDPVAEIRADADWTGFARARIRRHDGVVLVAEQAQVRAGYIDLALAGAPRTGLRDVLYGCARWLIRGSSQVVPWSRRPCGVLHDLYVTEALRNRGVATRLLEEGLSWLRQRGAERVEASVASSNEAMRTLLGRDMHWREARIVLRRELQVEPPKAGS